MRQSGEGGWRGRVIFFFHFLRKFRVELTNLSRLNRMSSVSPVKLPKKKKKPNPNPKKKGQEDNIASNVNTTMSGPAPNLFQHPYTSPVSSEHQHYHPSTVDPQFYASTNPSNMHETCNKTFSWTFNRTFLTMTFRHKVQAFKPQLVIDMFICVAGWGNSGYLFIRIGNYRRHQHRESAQDWQTRDWKDSPDRCEIHQIS